MRERTDAAGGERVTEPGVAPVSIFGFVGLVTFLTLLRQHWRVWLLSALIGAVGALVLSFLMPARFRAEASFLPSNQFAGQADSYGLAGLAQAAREFGLGTGSADNPSALFPQLVSSRRLLGVMLRTEFTDRSGRKGPLAELLDFSREDTSLDKAIRHLRSRCVSTHQDVRSGISKVSVVLADPVLAAQVANACVGELDRLNREELVSNARRQVDFVGSRLEEVRGQLTAAEEELTLFRESNRNRAGSPHLQTVERRLARNLELQEQLYVTLRQQLEMARIDEVKNLPVITIIDRAVPPRHRLGPGRALWALLGALAGVAVGAAFSWWSDLPRTG